MSNRSMPRSVKTFLQNCSIQDMNAAEAGMAYYNYCLDVLGEEPAPNKVFLRTVGLPVRPSLSDELGSGIQTLFTSA